jgi:Fe-S cluster assembly protein SufD
MAVAEMTESMKRSLEARSAGGPAWLAALREAGARGFETLGLPGPRDEAWKYTSTASIAREVFEPVATAQLQYEEAAVAAAADRIAGRLGGPVLVFVDGHMVPALSRTETVPGVEVSSLAEVLAATPEALEPWLGRTLDGNVHGFAALNSAFLEDGLVVRAARGAHASRPISALFWSTARPTAVASHPRNLIVAEEGSSVTVFEHYAGEGVYLSNSATEIVVGANAEVGHVGLVEEAADGFHVGRIEASVARDGRLRSHAVALAGRLNRTEIHARLAGENAEAVLRGVYCLDGRSHADHHTSVDHEVSHTRSEELYKGVLDDRSRGVFTGRIVIRPDAQKVDSRQTNNNLLISAEAVAETRPQLEIYADDVKASHGATIGRLDATKLFYMRARGLDEAEAKRLLTYAFAGEPLEDIADDRLREAVAAAVQAKVETLHTEAAPIALGHTETEDLK